MALLVSATAVFAAAPANAANTNLPVDCSTQFYSQTVNNSDTVTITLQVPSCVGFIVLNSTGGGGGVLGSATLNSVPMVPGSPTGVSNGDVIVYTAPASGSGSDGFGVLPALGQVQIIPTSNIQINFPVPTPRGGDSMVDNGNGSMTVTFAPLSNSEVIFVNLFPSGTTCPANGSDSGRLYVMTSSPQPGAFMTSPAVISAGSLALTFPNNAPPPVATPIAAGSYQACMNYNSGFASPVLVQSLAITLGAVAPDPVTPAFTG